MNKKVRNIIIGVVIVAILLLPAFLNPPKKEVVSYKTVSTYEEYKKIVESDKITMAVFGRNSCSWCNKFKPIYNEVAGEYNIDIYYFDSDSFDKDEYNKIMNMAELKVLAQCNRDNVDKALSEGFGTPLTLFTKSNETIDCIGGYVDKDELITKLKSVGMI